MDDIIKRYEKKNNLLYEIIILNISNLTYKTIFREYRTLKMIQNKSNYLLQIKKIELNQDDKTSKLNLIYNDAGIDLYSLINSKIFDYTKQKNLIKWILFQILKGLETLHSLNIVHRDLNPKSILISEKGEINIFEFGSSINDIECKFIDDKVVGYLPYIAPECLIRSNFNNKIDIYSVGIIMIELYYRKTNFLISEEDNERDSYSKRFFMQLKHLSNSFGINFDFNYSEDDSLKDELNSWLKNSVKFETEKFNKFFDNNPALDKPALELLKRLLAFNPKDRISAREALKMEYFREFQYLNKEEYSKKNKSKNSEDLSNFIKNLEKEFKRVEMLPQIKRMSIFQNEIKNFVEKKVTD